MRTQITHIIKNDFFPVFKQAFFATINKKNVQSGFSGTSLVLYNLEQVINSLDFRSKMSMSTNSFSASVASTNPNTLKTAKDVVRNSTDLKSKIARHYSSSPTHLYKLIKTQTQDISKLAHKIVLLEIEVKTLCTANKILSKYCKANKRRVQAKESLNVSEVVARQSQKNNKNNRDNKISENKNCIEEDKMRRQRCGNCNKPDYNARTC